MPGKTSNQQPKISTTQYDLVVGVKTKNSWVLLTTPRGVATERERGMALDLISKLHISSPLEAEAPDARDPWSELLSAALATKLGAIVVHAAELANPGGDYEFDGGAINGLLQNPDVREWLESFPPGLLPVRRTDAP